MIDQDVLRFRSPCALIVPINVIHGFYYESDSDGWVLTLADYFVQQVNIRLPLLNQLLGTPSAIKMDENASSLEMVDKRIHKIQKELVNKSEAYEILIESDLISILVELHRVASSESEVKLKYSNKKFDLVYKFKALIEEHLCDNLKIPQYSQKLNVSAFQLRSACESVLGKLPKELLEDRIITEAKLDLIFSNRSIEQIGYKAGFMDPSYFTRFYKKWIAALPPVFERSLRRRRTSKPPWFTR